MRAGGSVVLKAAFTSYGCDFDLKEGCTCALFSRFLLISFSYTSDSDLLTTVLFLFFFSKITFTPPSLVKTQHQKKNDGSL